MPVRDTLYEAVPAAERLRQYQAMAKPSPNGVRVGDVVLLVNPHRDDERDGKGALLSVAASLLLRSVEWLPGRRRDWALTVSSAGQPIAQRVFGSRGEAEAARSRVAAEASSAVDPDWQRLLDAA